MKLKKISTFIVLFLLCLIPSKVFAYDGVDVTNDNAPDNLNDTVTYFEKVATKEDEDYVRLRNSLINLYGIDKAYTLLGSTKNIVSSYAVPGETTSREVSKFIPSKGTMKVTMYKNPQSNYMDIWGEMTFSSGNKAGLIAFDDLFALNFDDTQVAKVSTSRTPSIINYNSSNSGGGEGRIQDGSTYARIVFTVKPNIISKNITECHGDTILLYGEKNVALPDNVSISVSGGSLSVSSGGHYSLNYLQYTGW